MARRSANAPARGASADRDALRVPSGGSGACAGEHRELAAALERGDGDEAAAVIDGPPAARAGTRSAITPLTGRPESPSPGGGESGSRESYQRTAWRLIRSRRA